MLDLDITPPALPQIARQLTPSDIKRLETPQGFGLPHHKRISQRHHFLAKCLAAGLSVPDAASMSGYAAQTVYNLKNEPAFAELISHYGEQVEDELINLSGRLSRISADALDVLQDRLENDPDKISVSELREIAKLGADRTGFGPQSTNVNVDGGRLAERMHQARKRIEERRKLIDVTPEN